jgi:hypothetical protein
MQCTFEMSDAAVVQIRSSFRLKRNRAPLALLASELRKIAKSIPRILPVGGEGTLRGVPTTENLF